MAARLYPEITVAAASAAWGLFWIPLRAFEKSGLTGTWAVLLQFLVPLLILVPFSAVRAIKRQATGIRQFRTGILIGLAVSLYLESLLLTSVARALILFYVMPTWATVLEVTIMRQPFTASRALSLVLGLSGLAVILGDGGTLFDAMNTGDLMALLSGILFALGALKVRNTTETSLFEQLFAFFLFSSIVSALFLVVPIFPLTHAPSFDQLQTLALWLLLAAAGFFIPVMTGIYWGSRHVDPGRLGILLQIEAVVGITSAALFANEPFGVRKAIGATLVVGAGFVEVLTSRQPRVGNRSRTCPSQ